MNKYSKYKDSGVGWIGEIPDSWVPTKLKYDIILTMGQSPESAFYNDEQIGVPFLQGNTDFGESYPVNLKWTTQITKLAKPGDILYSVRGSIGEMNFADKEYCIGRGLSSISSKNLNQRFIFYLLTASKEKIQSIGVGSTFLSITIDDLKSLTYFVPTSLEQNLIVSFLDQKTSIIDDLIQKKLLKIDLLKEQRTCIINHAMTKGLVKDVDMKNSKVIWIGEIPENWKINKIKRLASTISKGTTPSTIGKEMIEEGDIRFLKAENIKNNEVSFDPTFYIDIETDTLLKRSSLKAGDILFVIAGATIGKTAILPNQFIPANTNQAVSFIRLKQDENKRFVWYWLLSTRIQEQISLVSVQSAQPNLSMEDLGNFQIPYPPLHEQHQIVEYLDKKTSEIDKQVDLEKRKIDLLKEYRQSIISEVVTGKIDVRTN